MFILLENEPFISQLHPRKRRGIDDKWSPINPVFDPSNPNESEAERESREWIEEDILVSELKQMFTSRKTLRSNRAYFCDKHFGKDCNTVSREDLAQEIFGKINHNRTTEILMNKFQPRSFLPDTRNFIVNLSNIRNMVAAGKHLDLNETKDSTIKPTIEFRQHACTLDTEEIKYWVRFCQKIVKLAEQRAQEAIPPFAERYPVWQQEMLKYPPYRNHLATLFGPWMLNLDRDEVEYWYERYHRYKNDEKIELRNRVDRRADRIRNKRKHGMPVRESERKKLRDAHWDVMFDFEALPPKDIDALAIPIREDYEALDISQLRRIAQYRDAAGEEAMEQRRKEDYVDFIVALDRKGRFGQGTKVPRRRPHAEATSGS